MEVQPSGKASPLSGFDTLNENKLNVTEIWLNTVVDFILFYSNPYNSSSIQCK